MVNIIAVLGSYLILMRTPGKKKKQLFYRQGTQKLKRNLRMFRREMLLKQT